MKVWLIWSNEHEAWWRPGRCGYTTRIEEAGRYGRAEADAICENANTGQPLRGKLNEIAVRMPEDLPDA